MPLATSHSDAVASRIHQGVQRCGWGVGEEAGGWVSRVWVGR